MSTFNTINSFSGVNSFLSNFDQTPFWWNGFEYRGNEFFFQAHKAKDAATHKFIRQLPTPRHAKLEARKISCRHDWEDIKLHVMKRGLILKFTQNSHLYTNLIHTDDAVLIEGNTWHDNFWGDCFCGKKSECQVPGQNHLGLLLMEIRVTLPALMVIK